MPIIVNQPTVSNNFTLLELIQQVCMELAINRPLLVVGNTDPQIMQLLAITNRLGRDLCRQFNWQRLLREYQVTTVDQQTNYSLPSDWLRQIPQAEWDRSSRWPLIGPATDQQWQVYKSAVIGSGPQLRFRIANGAVEVDPADGGLDISFYYVSKNWIEASDGTTKFIYTQDDDVSIFDDSLMITGIKAQWKAAKGLDGTFDLAEFRTLLEQCKSQDRSAPRLSLSATTGSVLLTEWNVQDGNWPAQ